MTSLSPALLGHDHLYLPWVPEKPVYQAAVPLTTRLHAHHPGRPLTVVCPQSRHAPVRLVGATVVTEREGAVQDGGVVLVYRPTYRLVRKFAQLTDSIVVLVEWQEPSFEGWARSVGAFNVVSGRVEGPRMSETGRRCIDDVIAYGDRGWQDEPARHATEVELRKLQKAGLYDRELILALARNVRGESAIVTLSRLMDQVEAPRSSRDHGFGLGRSHRSLVWDATL